MPVESRPLARVCYRAAFGVARRLVVTARRTPDPHPETDPVQVLGPSATPVAPSPSRSRFQTSEVSESDIGGRIALVVPDITDKGALGRPPRSCGQSSLDLPGLICGDPSRTDREVTDGD